LRFSSITQRASTPSGPTKVAGPGVVVVVAGPVVVVVVVVVAGPVVVVVVVVVVGPECAALVATMVVGTAAGRLVPPQPATTNTAASEAATARAGGAFI
jgi:hypothetical protein